MNLNAVILFGPPASGKGTQAKFLCEEHKLTHLSTGDILRSAVAAGSDLGKKVKSIMDEGGLVSDEIICALVEDRLHELVKQEKQVLFDGFPRTIKQAKELDRILAGMDVWNPPIVFSLTAKEKTVVQRITGRRSCPDCGAVYHIQFSPPKTEGICDSDNAELQSRPDDVEEVVRARFQNYLNETEPVLGYFQEVGHQIMEIDGELSVGEVTNAINNLMGAGHVR